MGKGVESCTKNVICMTHLSAFLLVILGETGEMQIKGEVCVEGRVWKEKEKGMLDSQRQEKAFLVKVIFKCFNPISPPFTFSPTSKYLAEKDISLSNLIHLNHKSLHGGIVLRAKKGPARRPA